MTDEGHDARPADLIGATASPQRPATGGGSDQTAHQRDEHAGARDETAGLRDRTADGRDRTGLSRDRTAERRDQTADARDHDGQSRDQTGDRRDEAADARDQVGHSRDRTADRRDETADARDRAGQQRDVTAGARDHTADQRDQAAGHRDQAAGHRDRTAGHRDQTADRRDQTADRRDQAADRREASANAGSAAVGHSPSALARRAAASDRMQASRDRHAGASDRTQARGDRSTAHTDRGAGTGERLQAGLDRSAALADRDAGAGERSQAERDRSTALADRDAGAGERSQAELDRSTALADRDAAAGERSQAELDRVIALADRAASGLERVEQVRLDAISRGKSEFLSRMSHELRTPLNAILGFGQLLEMDALSAEQRDSVEHISKAGRHLLELIDEVLDIAQVERGELRLSLEPVSLRQVVGQSLGMLRPLAAARGVRLDGAANGAHEHVLADRTRLQQVVVNLLANAIKYNGSGGEVSVQWSAVDARVRLVVTDTGVGIADEDLARLFLPFERLGAERSDVEGTGLGLSLSKQLVEAMGGEIGVASQLGVGSSFWVELPVADAPRQQAQELLVPVAPAPVDAGPRTVLYVEDNVSNVKLVERIVARRPGVTLMVAMQGLLGLDLAFEHRPSLVLLDLHLPDLPGEEVLRRLRADPRTAVTPVVVLSADATRGQAERLRAEGATDYLTKPLDIPRLLRVIDGAPVAEEPTDERSAPSTQARAEHLDPTIVASLHDLGRDCGGPDGIRSLVTTFLDDSGIRFAELRAAVAEHDATGVERLAHTLAGSSANLGARALAAGCWDMEARAQAGAVHDVARLLPRVDEAFTDARAALRAEFLGSDGPMP